MDNINSYEKPAQATNTYTIGAIGKIKVIVDALSVYDSYIEDADEIGKVNRDESYFVYKELEGCYLIGNGQWIFNDDEDIVFTPIINEEVEVTLIQPAPVKPTPIIEKVIESVEEDPIVEVEEHIEIIVEKTIEVEEQKTKVNAVKKLLNYFSNKK